VLSLEDNEASFGFDSPILIVDPSLSPYAQDILNTTTPKPATPPPTRAETNALLTKQLKGEFFNFILFILIIQGRLLDIDSRIAALQDERNHVLASLRALQEEAPSTALTSERRTVSEPSFSSIPSLELEPPSPEPLPEQSPGEPLSPILESQQSASTQPLSQDRKTPPRYHDEPVTRFERAMSIVMPSVSGETQEEIGLWTPERVSTWLSLVDLGQFASLFMANGIKGEIIGPSYSEGLDLLDLNEDDLLSMGLNDRDMRAHVIKEACLLVVRNCLFSLTIQTESIA
jgi:hypothetical protein